MKIENDEIGKTVELKVFFSFGEVKDEHAQSLAEDIINSLEEKGSDLRRCRSQGYDGAAGLSGVYHRVQQCIKEKAPHALSGAQPNLVLKEAVKGNIVICHFFGHIIVRCAQKTIRSFRIP